MPFSQRMIDAAKKRDKLESVSGVGDEAYFHNNKDRYAELYVKTGKYLLTLRERAHRQDIGVDQARGGGARQAAGREGSLRVE